MKKILCPVDFSEVSYRGVNFANELIKVTGGTLILMNLYHITPIEPGTASYLSSDIITESEDMARKGLQDIINGLSKGDNVVYEYVVKYGIPEDEVPHFARVENVDLIVMGTEGAEGLKKIFVGSVTATVVEESGCPVLVVPANVEYRPIKQIVYATDLKGDESDGISFVINLAQVFDAKISFFSIQKTHNYKEEQEFIKYAMENILFRHSYPNMSFDLNEGEDIESGINAYAKSKNADILVMATQERGFLKKLFTRSQTKEIVYNPQLPILAVHKQVEHVASQ
jgi:nucleotide-binding universal stress UspA family protein